MRKYLIPLILVIAFLVVGILTLSDYGINWDAPLSILRGQAYVDVFLNKKPIVSQKLLPPNNLIPGTYASRYYFASVEAAASQKVILPQRPLPQNENQKDRSFYQHPAYNGQIFKETDNYGHLPLIAIISAFSNRFFWGNLGWFGDIESYQIVYILISALGVFLVSLFAYEISGSYLAALVAGLSLGLFPIYFGESHINMKDPEQAVFFLGSIWAFWHWVKGDKLGRLGRFGVFMMFVAFALAVKWNIVFLPFILTPWLFTIRKTEEFKAWFKLGRLGKLGGLGILGVILFLWAIWPYAWTHPIQAFINIFSYYLEQGVGKALIQPPGFILPGGFNIYPLLLFLTQTPEIILILGGIGVIWVILRRSLPRVELRGSGQVRERGGKLKIGYLLLFWLLVPILRLSFPGARTYGGLRQIMEVVPAMAILAGMGGSYLSARWRVQSAKLQIAFGILLFIILLFPIIRLHPNENVYFNYLVGGLKGAQQKGLIDWTLTYGNVYKQGVKWLNEHAEKNANLAHLAGSDFSISPLWLRDDISISPYHFSGFDQKGEYIMALYNPLDPPVFAKRYPEKFLNPVHIINVDGIPLLFIYKNEPKYLKVDLNKEKELRTVKMIPQSTKETDFWKVDLGQDLKVSRIIISQADLGCKGGQNEVIAFVPQAQSKDPIDLSKAYVLNEKKDLEDGRIEYSFAAEPARFIYIYPQNNQSCFAKEKILIVSYLKE